MQHSSLSPEQRYALDQFIQGNNLFITGSAGTGKSFLVQKIIERATQDNKIIQVCAMTGIAAVLLGNGARTIHSWSGVALCKGSINSIVKKVLRNFPARNSWKRVHVLVIDEVSMMSKHMFNVLEEIGRATRHSRAPFGGIQVIALGDMFQLPPIGDADVPDTDCYCFESDRWETVFHPRQHIELHRVFRQSDPHLVRILNEVRLGQIDEEGIQTLKTRLCLPDVPPDITKLFSTRANVQKINLHENAKLPGPEHKMPLVIRTDAHTWIDSGTPFDPDTQRECDMLSEKEMEREILVLKGNVSYCQDDFVLKKGSVVMCTANLGIEMQICNGSQGVVVDFYVPPPQAEASPAADVLPIVKFKNGAILTMTKHQWQHSKYPCITLSQVPLTYAWATTIHKSQGMSLDQAEMNLGSQIFEYGQAYVALSRVRSLEGIYLSDFNPRKIKANPRVLKFWKEKFGGGGGVACPEPEPVSAPDPEPEPDQEPVLAVAVAVPQYIEACARRV